MKTLEGKMFNLAILSIILLHLGLGYGQKELGEGARNNLEKLFKKISDVAPTKPPTKPPTKSPAVKPLTTISPVTILPNAYPIDVIFVVDASYSIKDYFACALQALEDIAGIIDHQNPLVQHGTNIGIVRFSDVSNVELEMRLGRSLKAVSTALRNMQFIGGSTRTEKGLNLARRMFINAGRPNSYKLLILVTDGQTYPIDPSKIATLIKNLGVEIYAIPVTDMVNLAEIKSVVSSPADDYIIQTYNYCQFANYVSKLKRIKLTP